MSDRLRQMAEAEDVAREVFGREATLGWRLGRHEGPELWLEVALPPEADGHALMQQFYDSYWLAVCNRRDFSVTTYARHAAPQPVPEDGP